MTTAIRKTLILNASYEPLAVVPLRRALVLVLLERAEIVATDGTYSHAEKIMKENPSIIRLREFVRVPFARRVPVTRRNVLSRDAHTCAYCGEEGNTIDHIIPRSRPNGPHTWMNVVTACRSCNGRKGARTPDEAGMPLRYQPTEPQGKGALVVLVGQTLDPEWMPYLSDRELTPAI